MGERESHLFKPFPFRLPPPDSFTIFKIKNILNYGDYILDAPNLSAQYHKKRKGEVKRVTLIVGIICKDSIVLASDTETTNGIYKVQGAEKINVVQFKDYKVLIANSGMCYLSEAALQIIERYAKVEDITQDDSVMEIIKKSMHEARQYQISLYPPSTPENWKIHFRDQNQCELTVAYFHGNKPMLGKINIDQCVLHKANQYLTSGVGGELGAFLMDEHSEREMRYDFGCAVAFYVVEKVKHYITGCGGETNIAVIQPRSAVFGQHPREVSNTHPRKSVGDAQIAVLEQNCIKKISEKVSKAMESGKRAQSKMIDSLLNETAKQVAQNVNLLQRRLRVMRLSKPKKSR